jgi:glycosyltransferase involved in cell wall biosynthesis
MSTTPRVSVLIPTYNYAHFLDDAIQSVLAQTYTDYELIIVDNASTDNTDEVVARYLSDTRVRYYKHPENIGLVANWNSGLKHTRGEFLKILCADDKFRPTLLEKYVRLMDQYPALSMVACNKQVFGKEYNYEVNLTLTHYQTGRDVNLHMLYGHQGVGEPTSVMFRRREFEKIGFFTGVYEQYVDLDYWIKLLSMGDCYLVPEILVDIRFHPATVSNQVKRKKYQRCFEEYQIRKDVQQHVYDFDTTNTRIDEMVRKYAMDCIKVAMLKTAGSLHKSASRKAFARAFRIAWKESLFSSTLGEATAGIKRKIARKAGRRSLAVSKNQ